MSNGRIYFDQNEEPGQSFFIRGKLEISKISRVPSLLVPEPGSGVPEFARIAHITHIDQ